MITEQTVFVLGAGASADYGFPLGGGLVQSIINWNRHPRFNDFKKAGLKINEFISAVNGNHIETIDAFLEQHDNFSAEGKYAITAVLSGIARNDYERGWYSKLWNKFLKEAGSGKVSDPNDLVNGNKISFITFNYDLSLETFLWNRFKNYFPSVENERMVKAISKIPILHIHGKIDFAPWEKRTIPPVIKIVASGMPAPTDADAALKLSEGIILAHEPGAEDRFKSAQGMIKKSKNVIFLGFGFHDVNKRKLAGRGKAIKVVDKYRIDPGSENQIPAVSADTHVETGWKTFTFSNRNLSTADVHMTEAARKRAKKYGFGLEDIFFYKRDSISEVFEDFFDEMIGEAPRQNPKIEN